ncbi:MAG: CPBP family intramembrane metalloprotease [Bacteroidia bacterium]|nr:CPBP family intramembrane metalloprotease [Bacteroidia bacterium]MBT8230110.1 CPBP family intramembrane metalloprotease [Bacteroidia bacterium]
MSFQKSLFQFFDFLNHPDPGYHHHSKESIGRITQLFFLVFAGIIFLYGPIMTLIGVEDLNHKMDELMKQSHPLVMMLTAVLIAPFFEEIVFRYPLKNASLSLLFILISLSCLFYDFLNLSLNLYYTVPIWFLCLLLCTSITDYFFRDKLQSTFQRYFPWVFYYSVVIFAFLHVYNFELSSEQWFLGPLLVIPQFILALLLGYVRIRNNIWSSIYLHALNNFIPLSLVFVSGQMQ